MQLNQSTRRLQFLLWGLLAWSGLLFGRLVWLQVIRHDAYLAAAHNQQQKTVELPALRGSIFDRTGQPLAMSLEADSVVVDPQKLQDLPEAATLLASTLHLDRRDLLVKLQAAKQRKSRFMWVARKLTPEESEKAHQIKLVGMEFRKEMRRYYPRTTLAAHVMGATGFLQPEDVIERGNAGIELAFESDLGGKPGQARLFTDSRQNSYDQDVVLSPEPGSDLTLTIDPNLQYRAEQVLAEAAQASGADGGSVVAMDPYTGEILAMANWPLFDPNERPRTPGDFKARMNQAVSRTFEPGSVFKVITLAAALEKTNLRPESIIDCGNGKINLFGRVVHDHDSYSSLTMAGVLAHSSNVGAIRIAMATGNENFYNFQRAFGFGSKTGITLPGETGGILWPVERWTKSSIGSLAMGHELGVTSLQLARAGSAIANGGLLVKPRLVMSKQRPGQEPEKIPQEQAARVLKPETAVLMRQMMEGVVLEGTGRKAVLAGYTSAGKTGSAQIYDPKTHVYTHTYNASFLGFAPVGNPRVVISVSLHGTGGGSAGYGGARAAPVFREVAMSALRLLDVPKDLPDRVLLTKTPKKAVSDLATAGSDDAFVTMAAAKLAAADETSPGFAYGDEPVRSQKKAARGVDSARLSELTRRGDASGMRVVSSVTQPLTRGGTPVSTGDSSTSQRPFFPAEGQPSGVLVPDFTGKTQRAVIQESTAKGLDVQLFGSGLALRQDPPPGASVRPGVTVKVQFGR
jgi:cell division protein FtsI (penicillin-binding protein 3)